MANVLVYHPDDDDYRFRDGVVLVEGYPFVPIGEVVTKNNFICVVEFLKMAFDSGLKKDALLSNFNAMIQDSKNITFVLLSCDFRTARRFGSNNKKEFKKEINYYNWAFSMLPISKRKIDVSVVGLKNASLKIEKLLVDEE